MEYHLGILGILLVLSQVLFQTREGDGTLNFDVIGRRRIRETGIVSALDGRGRSDLPTPDFQAPPPPPSRFQKTTPWCQTTLERLFGVEGTDVHEHVRTCTYMYMQTPSSFLESVQTRE